jgi:hypothetical protein
MRGPDGKFAADGHVLELLPTDITNDLDLAARVAGADSRAQAALHQSLQVRSTPLPTKDATPPSSSTASAARPIEEAPAPRRAGTGLNSNNSLGAAHSRVKDGWVYEKNSSGEWVPVRNLH